MLVPVLVVWSVPGHSEVKFISSSMFTSPGPSVTLPSPLSLTETHSLLYRMVLCPSVIQLHNQIISLWTETADSHEITSLRLNFFFSSQSHCVSESHHFIAPWIKFTELFPLICLHCIRELHDLPRWVPWGYQFTAFTWLKRVTVHCVVCTVCDLAETLFCSLRVYRVFIWVSVAFLSAQVLLLSPLSSTRHFLFFRPQTWRSLDVFLFFPSITEIVEMFSSF